MDMRKKTEELAHTLWVDAGRPVGRDQEFWLEAESKIKEEEQTESRRSTAIVAIPSEDNGGESRRSTTRSDRFDGDDDIDAYNRRGNS